MHDGEIDITIVKGGKGAEGKTVYEHLEFLWPKKKNADSVDDPARRVKQHPITLLISELFGWFKGLYIQNKKQKTKAETKHKKRGKKNEETRQDIRVLYLETER